MLKGFKAYLLLERGLSAHTLDAYLRDVGKLAEFRDLEGLAVGQETVTLESLQQFLWRMNELGLGARSQARLLSALKTFFKYLLLENIVEQDPTELLEAPRTGRAFPYVMT